MYSAREVYPIPQHSILGHYRIYPCKCILYKCIRVTQDANSSRSTNRKICAYHNSVMQKGVRNGIFVIHQFLFIKQTYLNGLRVYFHRPCRPNLVHIVSFGIYFSVLEGVGGGGREALYQI